MNIIVYNFYFFKCVNSILWPMLNIFECMNSANSVAIVIFVSCIVASRDFTVHVLKKKKKKSKTLKLKRAIQMDTKCLFWFKLLWRLCFCYAVFSSFFFFFWFSLHLLTFPCSRTNKFYFSTTFSLKIGSTALFIYLKIILLQYF